MHIALVTSYPPSKATLNEYGFHMVQALKRKPEISQISIIADSLDPKGKLAEIEQDIAIHRVWRFNDPYNSRRIHHQLKKISPDVVLFNLQFASFGDKRLPAALGLLAPSFTKRYWPTITLLHNIFETVDLGNAGFSVNPWVDKVTKIAGYAFTKALLNSHLLALTMPRYVDILREKYQAKNVFLAPHGAFGEAEPIRPLPETPTVMAFGKFGTYKKVEILLEAHKRLLERNPNIHLVIAGSDSPNTPGYLAGVAERYQGLANVRFTGYVPEEEVATTFINASVVAFPYESTTGSSGPLHQAGQYARPAVLPRIGDLGDLIEEEGYAPCTFESGDLDSLTEVLWQLLNDNSLATSVGLQNYRAATGIMLNEVMDWYILHFERLLQYGNT